MLAMIERNASRLMKCGGGALSREDPRRRAVAALSPERRAHVVALVKAGKLSKARIAEIVGTTRAVVQGICSRDGINAPDGRGMENRGRAKR